MRTSAELSAVHQGCWSGPLNWCRRKSCNVDGDRERFHLSHPPYSYWSKDEGCGPRSLLNWSRGDTHRVRVSYRRSPWFQDQIWLFTDKGTEVPKRLDFLVLKRPINYFNWTHSSFIYWHYTFHFCYILKYKNLIQSSCRGVAGQFLAVRTSFIFRKTIYALHCNSLYDQRILPWGR